MEAEAGQVFYYVYIMRSIDRPGMLHVGYTVDLTRRMEQHNDGRCFETSQHLPWELVWQGQFTDRTKAINFEKFLKTRSGMEFYRNRLI